MATTFKTLFAELTVDGKTKRVKFDDPRKAFCKHANSMPGVKARPVEDHVQDMFAVEHNGKLVHICDCLDEARGYAGATAYAKFRNRFGHKMKVVKVVGTFTRAK
jgi:hypothetical protein